MGAGAGGIIGNIMGKHDNKPPQYSGSGPIAPHPPASAPPAPQKSGAGGKLGAAAIGLGAGALLGGFAEHEWDKHEERIYDQEHHHQPQHHAAAAGGIGGLVGGFGRMGLGNGRMGLGNGRMGLGNRGYESETVVIEDPAPVFVDETVVRFLIS